jgi:hypothetical protein
VGSQASLIATSRSCDCSCPAASVRLALLHLSCFFDDVQAAHPRASCVVCFANQWSVDNELPIMSPRTIICPREGRERERKNEKIFIKTAIISRGNGPGRNGKSVQRSFDPPRRLSRRFFPKNETFCVYIYFI